MNRLKPVDPTLPAYYAEKEYRHRLYIDFKKGFWEPLTQDELEDTVEVYEQCGFARTCDLPTLFDGAAWRRVTAILNKLVALIPAHCHETWGGIDCVATFDDKGIEIIDAIDDLLERSWERLVGDWEIRQAADWYKYRDLGITAATTNMELEAMYSDLWDEAEDAHIVLEGLLELLYHLRRERARPSA